MLLNELLAYLFDDRPHILAEPMAARLASSRRFAAFATTFRDKIRKKLRTTQDQETLLDLQLELETAYLLLREKALSLVYEPPCGQNRCPDFGVDFTTSLTFMVEVTRLRAMQDQRSGAPSSPPAEEALTDTICSKLGQLPSQRSNVLILGMDVLELTPGDLQATLLRLKQRAERNDPAFWQRYRFRDRADFFRHYQRLSEVLVRGPELRAGESPVTWSNPQAKHPLPGRVRTVLHRSHTV